MNEPRDELREMIAEVAQREFENSITTAGTVAFRDYLGSRIAAEVMSLFPDVERSYRDAKGRWWGGPYGDSFQVMFTARTALYPLAARAALSTPPDNNPGKITDNRED